MLDLSKMTDKQIIAMMGLRFRRIGLNTFRCFIYEPDGKLNRMYEEILDAETCTEISNISMDELRKMPIEKPEDVEPQTLMSMKGVLMVVLNSKNDETPKILPAKKMLAERLAMRGVKETDLQELSRVQIVGRTLPEKITNYLSNLQTPVDIQYFIETAYSRGWLDDAAVQKWISAVGISKSHKR